MKWLARFCGGVIMMVLSVVLTQATHAAEDSFMVTVEIRHGDERVSQESVFVPWAGCTVETTSGGTYVAEGPKAICALQVLADSSDFEYRANLYEGFGLFLDSVNGVQGDFENYWLYYVNIMSPSVGISHYDLKAGDTLLLAYGGFEPPLRLVTSDRQVVAGEGVEVYVDAHRYDVELGATLFQPVSTAILTVDHESGLSTTVSPDEDGVARFSFPLEGRYTLRADDSAFLSTESVSVRVYGQLGAKKKVAAKRRTTLTKKGWDNVKSHIGSSQMVDDSIALTEWSAIAAKSAGVHNPKRLVNAVRAYDPQVGDGTLTLARHILALEAIGDDANWANGVNYVDRLKSTRVNNQYGAESLCNDDIFAALAMIAADEAWDTQALGQAVEHSLTCVQNAGTISYGQNTELVDIDTTAAWLMMAGQLKGKEATHEIELSEERGAAIAAIRGAQNPDGGWGWTVGADSNSSTTAWVLLGLRAQGEKANTYQSNNRSGFHYLSSVAQSNGSIAYDTAGTQSLELLNTAYTMMALNKAPLPINKSGVKPSVFNSAKANKKSSSKKKKKNSKKKGKKGSK